MSAGLLKNAFADAIQVNKTSSPDTPFPQIQIKNRFPE